MLVCTGLPLRLFVTLNTSAVRDDLTVDCLTETLLVCYKETQNVACALHLSLACFQTMRLRELFLLDILLRM